MRTMMTQADDAGCHAIHSEQDLQNLRARVSAEFREMPGLTLTLAQAARLFSIEPAKCERVLGALIERGVLATDGRIFARADTGARCA